MWGGFFWKSTSLNKIFSFESKNFLLLKGFMKTLENSLVAGAHMGEESRGFWTPAFLPNWPKCALITRKPKSVEFSNLLNHQNGLWKQNLFGSSFVLCLYNRLMILHLFSVLPWNFTQVFLQTWNFLEF